jgi:hypothetical protein
MPGARFVYCNALEKGMDMMVIPNRGRVLAVMVALALAGGLLTLALLAKPSQAQSNGATTEWFDIEFTHDATACSGEIIKVTGTMHFVNSYVPKEDGTFNVNSHLRLQANGVGQTTGNEYVVRTKSFAHEYYHVEPGQYLFGAMDTTMLVAKGSTPNSLFLTRFIFIVNPDGSLRMEDVSFHDKCQQ